MGIQPIDLQNMYSQMVNVSKNLTGQQQAAQMTEAANQKNEIQKNIENNHKVQKTSNDNQNAALVNSDGRSGGGSGNPNKNFQDNKSDNEETSEFTSNTSYKSKTIGTIIDIMR